tara:strand:- start:48 stop:263 length:216 start_codon:yes stop_codon:yes gene_type:complete
VAVVDTLINQLLDQLQVELVVQAVVELVDRGMDVTVHLLQKQELQEQLTLAVVVEAEVLTVVVAQLAVAEL